MNPVTADAIRVAVERAAGLRDAPQWRFAVRTPDGECPWHVQVPDGSLPVRQAAVLVKPPCRVSGFLFFYLDDLGAQFQQMPSRIRSRMKDTPLQDANPFQQLLHVLTFQYLPVDYFQSNEPERPVESPLSSTRRVLDVAGRPEPIV